MNENPKGVSRAQKLAGNEKTPFSEALQACKFGCFNCYIIFVCGIVMSIVLFEMAAVGFVLPIAQCDLKLKNRDKGMIMSIGYIGIIVSSHFWGFLADTQGRKVIIMPTCFLAFITSALSSISVNFWMLLTLRFFNGILLAGSSATVFAYLSEFHSVKTQSRAIMGASIIFSLFSILLPVIAYLVINQNWSYHMSVLNIDYKPWRLYLLVSGTPGLISGFLFLFLPESPKFLLSKGKQEKCEKALQTIYKWNGGKEQLEIKTLYDDEEDAETLKKRDDKLQNSNFCVAFLSDMWQQTVPLFGKAHLRSTIISCFIQFWLYFVINGMFMWFPEIANSLAMSIKNQDKIHRTICEIVNSHASTVIRTPDKDYMVCIEKLETTTYMYSMIMEILYFVYHVVISLIIHKIDKRIIIFFVIMFSAINGLVAFNIHQAEYAVYLYVIFFLVGVAINVLGSATVELYPTNLRAMAISLSLNGGRLGSVIGANAVGVLLNSHCELTFYIGCISLLICSVLIFVLPKTSSQGTAPRYSTIMK